MKSNRVQMVAGESRKVGMLVTLCIPTLNPGVLAKRMVASLKYQTLPLHEILVIDSASSDGSVQVFEEIGAKIISIRREDFDHGTTRNIAFQTSSANIYVFITQDAIPADKHALQILVNSLYDHSDCALVYGRQIPDDEAGAFARHTRLYNYPEGNQLELRSVEDIPRLGIRTAFCSDSFAAYRYSAMEQIGFFPNNTLFAEDSIAAAKLLQHGWKIGYDPQAVITHSHEYSMRQEFCRYFDMGVFHGMNPWYMDLLGNAEGEGFRFVLAEYAYLKRAGITLAMLRVIFRNTIRFSGYRTGRMHAFLPLSVKQAFSTNQAFWLRLGKIR